MGIGYSEILISPFKQEFGIVLQKAAKKGAQRRGKRRLHALVWRQFGRLQEEVVAFAAGSPAARAALGQGDRAPGSGRRGAGHG
jgi:hypothetical protein